MRRGQGNRRAAGAARLGARVLRVVLLPIALLVLLGASLLIGAGPAYACSCTGTSVAEAYQRAEAVFTGRLESREARGGRNGSSGDTALHVFAVDRVFLGEVHQRQGVLSADSGASCGLELRGPGPFLVFAGSGTTGVGPAPRRGQLAADLCGGSAPVTPALVEEVSALSAPAGVPIPTGAAPAAADGGRPLAGAAGTGLGQPATSRLAAAGGAGAAALVLTALLLRRRIWRSRVTSVHVGRETHRG